MVREIKSFVYGECTFEQVGNNPAIIVDVAARKIPGGYHHPTINSHDILINMYPWVLTYKRHKSTKRFQSIPYSERRVGHYRPPKISPHSKVFYWGIPIK